MGDRGQSLIQDAIWVGHQLLSRGDIGWSSQLNVGMVIYNPNLPHILAIKYLTHFPFTTIPLSIDITLGMRCQYLLT